MARSFIKQLFVFSALGIFGLFLLACSAELPVSSPVGSAQVNSVAPALADEGTNEVDAQVQPAVVEAPESTETEPIQETVVAAAEPEAPVSTFSESLEPPAGVSELLGDSGEPAQKSQLNGAGSIGIVTSGSGVVSSAPDLATLRLGVEATAGTVGEARTTAATALTEIITSVQEGGVEQKDVQTGYFSIQPRYTGREVTRCVDGASATEEIGEKEAIQEGPATIGISPASQEQECFQEYQSVITGYQVSNNVTVLVRDLDTVDNIIDSAVAAGGDNIRFNGLSFSLEDTAELEAQARSEAVADLAAKASELASLAGVELGHLIYLTEGGAAPPPVVRAEFALARAAFDSPAGVSTPIAPGEVSVVVNVVGHYLISQPE